MGSFVTTMIELNEQQITQISKIVQEDKCEMSMRFIKPSQFFYDQLMSIWVRLTKTIAT